MVCFCSVKLMANSELSNEELERALSAIEEVIKDLVQD